MLIVFSITACGSSRASHNERQVIRVDKVETAVHIDFTAADPDLLNNYKGQDLSTADVLEILDKKNFKEIPNKVVEKLDLLKWDWDMPFEERAGAVLEYDN
ncbi:hypothetical protein [Alkalibaculum sporogenes]|uniref:hypothetical protein n=1 Tax=Alkalibaculum sporogenes TaxID=2655001 RepID=UPI001A9BFDCE|nr:hypothetical protein [Alkalibaculum sporogenes]